MWEAKKNNTLVIAAAVAIAIIIALALFLPPQPVPKPADPDGDGDGIADRRDNCPTAPNANQLNLDDGQFGDACDDDLDGDGVENAKDNCPSNSNQGQLDRDGDGKGDACDQCPDDPQNDIDKDGKCASADNCPTITNQDQKDQDGDGQGDACDSVPLSCSSYCSSQGYQESVAQDVSQAQCSEYQNIEPSQCQTTCGYLAYQKWSWTSGGQTVNDFSCCCRIVERHQCTDCPGENPVCPVCPAQPQGSYGG